MAKTSLSSSALSLSLPFLLFLVGEKLILSSLVPSDSPIVHLLSFGSLPNLRIPATSLVTILSVSFLGPLMTTIKLLLFILCILFKFADLEWVQEERVTLFTSDGLIQIGGSMVPRRLSSSDKKQRKLKSSQRFQRFQESDYMDPNQGLCLGALFDIAATNGLDMGRRLCIIGFCRSIEMLSDVVEDTVLEHGGEVVAAEKAIKGGLHEKLSMTVAVPYLWGVPPASDTLHLAVRSGGGIVEKVYWQWDFL
ncbi:hypothetical protein CXB51_001248 [Gossypium anomalum]|uniref:DUF7811 domain-containing protein n=1 Tax=Gossypium anomalum TaxID=47600 RepID=A0A8J5ZRP3_9ROSI|nr:hypothetical protein CXB51_001248 [Gossypium anomalum]